MREYLGKTLNIIIDRPIGCAHPEHPELIYSANYGYIPDIMGGDGEPQDVYLLGVDTPVSDYVAKIIGIIHRDDDTEDKLVAAPEGIILNQAEIAEKVLFQEKFFRSRYEALYPKSCGAFVFRRGKSGVEYLCLKQTSGVYSVPKGHMEAFESEEQTAKREIFEEIGLSLDLMPDYRAETVYHLKYGKKKTLIMFIAEYKGEMTVDPGEITEYCWAAYTEAKQILPGWYHAALEAVENKLNNNSL